MTAELSRQKVYLEIPYAILGTLNTCYPKVNTGLHIKAKAHVIKYIRSQNLIYFHDNWFVFNTYTHKMLY